MEKVKKYKLLFFIVTLIAAVGVTTYLNLVPVSLLNASSSHSSSASLASAEEKAVKPPLQSFGPDSFVNVVEIIKPAVVNISTTQVIKGRKGLGPFPFGQQNPFKDFFGEDFWEKYFGQMPKREFKTHSLGSGFLIDKEGYILTNNHVIADAQDIKVKLDNGKEFDGEVIGTDSKTDIALIKIKATEELPVVKLGDSEAIKVGEWVIAIGNPFGLTQTVTVGVVSAKGRVIGMGAYDDFIQTDASINPGNSGGPLINIHGEVIGINTAIISSGQGIGFAIPINMAKTILEDLKVRGKVRRGLLGVYVQKLTPELAKSFNLPENEGALVSSVNEGGPADKAGIKQGDVIIEFNGERIKSFEELPRLVASVPPGSKAQVTVVRNGKKMNLEVTLSEMEAEIQTASVEEVKQKLGMTVQNITPEIARYFSLKDQRGIIVADVEAGSPAQEAGFRQGDIIVEINREKVTSVDEFNKKVSKSKKDEPVLFLIKRGEASLFIAVKVG